MQKSNSEPTQRRGARRKKSGYDNICKVLAEESPIEWIEWLMSTRPTTEVSLIGAELTRETLRPDFLAEWAIDDGLQALHIEFQVNPESSPPLPVRMMDYGSTYFRRRPEAQLHQVVIILRPTSVLIPTHFTRGGIHWPYHVIKLWEIPAKTLLQHPALVPLAVLAQHQEDTAHHLLRVAQAIRQLPPERQGNAMTSAEVLAGLVFDADLIETILKHEVMKESVTYQRIVAEGVAKGMAKGLEEGLEKGIEKGLEKGIEKGVKKGHAETVRQALSMRFGDLPAPVLKKVASLRDQKRLNEILRLCVTNQPLSDVLAAIDARD